MKRHIKGKVRILGVDVWPFATTVAHAIAYGVFYFECGELRVAQTWVLSVSVNRESCPKSYVVFPWDIRREFGKGRVKVHATFDGIPYDGSIVNMGLKNTDGSICYVIGVLKAIRQRLGKVDGDTIRVTIKLREA